MFKSGQKVRIKIPALSEEEAERFDFVDEMLLHDGKIRTITSEWDFGSGWYYVREDEFVWHKSLLVPAIQEEWL